MFKAFSNSKKKEHSYILLNARKGICRGDLTARMSYVLPLESQHVWHSPAILIETLIVIAAAYNDRLQGCYAELLFRDGTILYCKVKHSKDSTTI
jgi:hypothetical protein